MSDNALRNLARAAGLHVSWTDASGHSHETKVETLRAVLAALGLPAGSLKAIAESHGELEHRRRAIPKLLTARSGEKVHLRSVNQARIASHDGIWRDLQLAPVANGGVSFRAPEAIGYYDFDLDGGLHTLAVAPQRCFGIGDASPGKRLAGLAVQIYSLRGGSSAGFGDFAALAEFSAGAAAFGIDAIAASPTHAGFAADTASFSPYAPSTRFFLDPVYADLRGTQQGGASDASGDLIDWPAVRRRKFELLRAAYERFLERGEESGQSFQAFCSEGGRYLRNHAVFEALHARFHAERIASFRQWPPPFRNPDSRAVREFADSERKEVLYHCFLQWLTNRNAAAAQATAREKMAIGIVTDVAVGVDRAGSHAWSLPGDVLPDLSIGAPPDAFNARGQDWGVTTFSPFSVAASGYESFIHTIRAAMRHAGGIRIDHAMGLRRLWVLPEGGSPTDGVYLDYPMDDLVRLIALESHLNRAIVVGEDLGTVPQGFRAQIAAAGILGMRVLWFERTSHGEFTAAAQWDAQAAALTTTHDLPTVSGWWKGRDIEWAEKLRSESRIGAESCERRGRKKDRSRLWAALTQSGCVSGKEPGPENAEPVADGALCHIGKTPCLLALAATEDVLGLAEQPNLPGSTDAHPNWRRRLPAMDFWSDPRVQARLSTLSSRSKR